jgi:hypothetical protein
MTAPFHPLQAGLPEPVACRRLTFSPETATEATGATSFNRLYKSVDNYQKRI